MSEHMNLADHSAAVVANYNKWVAIGAIDVAGARAYNEGDLVSDDGVQNGSVSRDLVRSLASKSGKAAVEDAKPS